MSDSRIVTAALRGPAGKEFLRFLKERYLDRKLYSDDPYKMAANVAQRDMVYDIINLVEGTEHE